MQIYRQHPHANTQQAPTIPIRGKWRDLDPNAGDPFPIPASTQPVPVANQEPEPSPEIEPDPEPEPVIKSAETPKDQAGRLSDAAVIDILESKDRVSALTERHGVSASTICNVRNGRTYGHVRPDIPRRAKAPATGSVGRLSDAAVIDILQSEEPVSVLQERHGVSRGTVYHVRQGRAYGDVRPDIPRTRDEPTQAPQTSKPAEVIAPAIPKQQTATIRLSPGTLIRICRAGIETTLEMDNAGNIHVG